MRAGFYHALSEGANEARGAIIARAQVPATGNGELSPADGEGWPMIGIAAGAALVALVSTLSLATVARLRRR